MNINGNWMNFAYMDNPRLYGSGNAIQHLHYLPFGEDWVDQRNSTWNAPYTFSGKEKDTETGYGYFGARYYDSGLSIWLSVDPMSDKYPNMSPYNYCANNPVILVDPDGRDVEYNNFSDFIIVAFTFLTDYNFREQFKELKNSTETYVFRGIDKSKNGGGTFSTDGDKLYINYNKGKDKEQGTNVFTNLRHESQHAVQFEHGEIGFNNQGARIDLSNSNDDLFFDPLEGVTIPNWENSASNYDLNDEYDAREFGYAGFNWDPKADNIRNWWKNKRTPVEDRFQSLMKAGYSGATSVNNSNTERIKTETEYKMPHRER